MKLQLSRWADAVVQLTQARDPTLETITSFLPKLYPENIEQLLKQGDISVSETLYTSDHGEAETSWLGQALQRLSTKHHGLISALHQPIETSSSQMLNLRGKSQQKRLKMNTATFLDYLETAELEQRLEQLWSNDEYEITRDPWANEIDIHLLKVSAIF